MAVCTPNTLLLDGKCFATLPAYLQQAAVLALWCNISGGIGPVPPSDVPAWHNPESGTDISNPESGPITNPEA